MCIVVKAQEERRSITIAHSPQLQVAVLGMNIDCQLQHTNCNGDFGPLVGVLTSACVMILVLVDGRQLNIARWKKLLGSSAPYKIEDTLVTLAKVHIYTYNSFRLIRSFLICFRSALVNQISINIHQRWSFFNLLLLSLCDWYSFLMYFSFMWLGIIWIIIWFTSKDVMNQPSSWTWDLH